MNPYSNQFDPSKMDPKLLMELSRVVQELPPSQIQKMQTLMHNMMAGLDVRREMEEFEKSLPPGFREKLMKLMGGPEAMAPFSGQMAGGPKADVPRADVIDISSSSSSGSVSGASSSASSSASGSSSASAYDGNMNLTEARLTILRAVADGNMSPEDAERLLFPER